jgi:hypothetical protein
VEALHAQGVVSYDRFKASLARESPPDGLSPALQALWWDAWGDWKRAHECAQEQEDQTGAWVHAYLHRKEGDLSNAGYWYRRARKPAATGTLDAEWDTIARALA